MQGLQAAVDGLFAKYDTNNSGALEFNEAFELIKTYLTGVGKPEPSKEQALAMFNMVDTSGNKKIEKAELVAALQKGF